MTASRFVVQLHDATTLHYDLRIQAGDILRSWAVPKRPSLDPRVRRLAVPTEDHALSAGDYEGIRAGQALTGQRLRLRLLTPQRLELPGVIRPVSYATTTAWARSRRFSLARMRPT